MDNKIRSIFSHDENDLTVKVGSTLLNIRVGAVVEDAGHILVEFAPHNRFYFLPGGRVKTGERTEHALLRELQEECACKSTDIRLWSMIENFFTHEGVEVHEFCFYYLVKGIEKNTLPVMPPYYWIPLETISSISLYPTSMQALLLKKESRQETFIHLVQAISGN